MLKLFNHESRQMARKNRFGENNLAGFTSGPVGCAAGHRQAGTGTMRLQTCFRGKLI
jgi:hypothetical protein